MINQKAASNVDYHLVCLAASQCQQIYCFLLPKSADRAHKECFVNVQYRLSACFDSISYAEADICRG